MPATTEVFFNFFEGKHQERSVKGKKVNVPRHRSKIVKLRERGIKEEHAQKEFKYDANINQRIGKEIEQDRMMSEKDGDAARQRAQGR